MFCSSFFSSETLVVVVSRLRSMIGVAAVTLTVSEVPGDTEPGVNRRRPRR